MTAKQYALRALALGLCLCWGASQALAVDLTYTGDPGDLKSRPSWGIGNTDPTDLFPVDESAVPSASGNTVIVNFQNESGKIGNAYGGLSNTGLATGNTLDIVDTPAGPGIAYTSVGGYSRLGAATDNKVYQRGGSSKNIYGGWTADAGEASGNSVFFSGGTATYVYGGRSVLGEAKGNSVIISGGTADSVHGGYSSAGEANGNSASISGGTVTSVHGGYVYAGAGKASGNSVTVSGGTVRNVFGGYSDTGSGEVSGNSVIISGGTVSTFIRLGKSSGPVLNNTLTISGNPDLSGALLGGSFADSWATDGNTLNLHAPVTVSGLIGFQNYNFYLPNTLAAGGTMLTVLHGSNGGDPVNIAGTTVHVGVEGGGSPLQIGDNITLIKDNSGFGAIGAPVNTESSGEGMVGISKGFSFDLATTTDSLFATVTKVASNDQLKSLPESRFGGLGLLTLGADMLDMRAIPQLRQNALKSAEAGLSGFVPFGVIGGGSMSYDSGSHVDVDGFNLLTGLGWNLPLNEGKNGSLLLGAFFEAGWGSYDSHNSFANSPSVKGDGDVNYYGGGLLARYDATCGGYVEASLRAGQVETDYSSADFQSAAGGKVDFDSTAAYFGAHAGLGYIWALSETASLDLYTKYIWTHQGSDSVTIQGDRIRFKSMDSQRWRAGARFAYAVPSDKGLVFTPYLGAAYEHEFDAKAKATSNGDPIEAPEADGSTGIGELGFSFKPSADSPLSFDLGLQGYTGKREGVTGSFQLKWEF